MNIVRQVQKTEITGQLFSGGRSVPSRDFRTGDDLKPGRSFNVVNSKTESAEQRSDGVKLQLRRVNDGNFRLLWPR
jgi:hypothetical protein